MPTLYNPDTKALLESVDVVPYLRAEFVAIHDGRPVTALTKTEITQDKLQAPWLLSPDLSAVRNADRTAKIAARYWKVSGQAIVEMDNTEKAAVDAALNPPDAEKDAMTAILAKADEDVTSAEAKTLILKLARRLAARGGL